DLETAAGLGLFRRPGRPDKQATGQEKHEHLGGFHRDPLNEENQSRYTLHLRQGKAQQAGGQQESRRRTSDPAAGLVKSAALGALFRPVPSSYRRETAVVCLSMNWRMAWATGSVKVVASNITVSWLRLPTRRVWASQ